MQQRHQFAKRALGQNFLTDETVVSRILSAFDAKPEDVVVEIGPGRGALTERLVGQAKHVYALEFDRDLAPLLTHRFGHLDNFTLVEGDALKLDFASLDRGDRQLRLIANLPYNISTAILQRLFEYAGVFEDCVLMFQREVAQRVMARPGTKDRGYLSVMTELYFSAEPLFDVSPGAFRPVPKVWSSVIRLTSLQRPHAPNEVFERLVAAGFAQKRKTIANNLKLQFPDYLTALSTAGIDPQRRAESLTLDEWLRLSGAIASEE